MALKPAAVVLNGPDVPLLANVRTFCATDAKYSRSLLSAHVRPICGRNGSSASIVPVLTSPTMVAAVFSDRTERKPAFTRTSSVIDHVSCRCSTTVSVSKSYSHWVSMGFV